MKVSFYLNKRRGKIYVRVFLDSRIAERATEIVSQPNDIWNQRLKRFTASTEVANYKNMKLAEIELKLRRIYDRLMAHEIYFDIDTIMTEFEGRHKKRERPLTINEAVDKFQQDYHEQDQTFNTVLKHLEAFVGGDISTHLIDYAWVRMLDEYLMKDKGLSYATRKVYLSKLGASLAYAYRLQPEHAKDNPFHKYDLLKGEAREQQIKYLSEKQVGMLYQHLGIVLRKGQGQALALFLLQIETGMSQADVMNITGTEAQVLQNYIIKDLQKRQYFRYTRTKGGFEAIVPVTEDLKDALIRVANLEIDFTARTYQRYLNTLGGLIGCKHLTSHMGRHTFAVRRLQDGYSMEAVAKMMGHTSTRKTEDTYAKVTLEKLSREAERVTKQQAI